MPPCLHSKNLHWDWSSKWGHFTSSSTGDADDTVTRLEKAKAMLDKGLISDAEFEAIKARIVNTL